MKRNLKLFMKDIITASMDIQEFVFGMTYSEFLHDKKTTSAVIRQFEIIGEAVKNIPESIKQNHPEIPWKDISGMRDRLIHGYFGLDYQLVWDTIETKLPELIASVEQILKDIEGKN